MLISLLAIIAALAFSAYAVEPIEALSINVRYGSANDGENAWAKRRDAMMDIVKSRNYDFIGGQEVLITQNDEANQIKFMSEKLPEYGVLFRSRSENENFGEGTPVFYRKDRWALDSEDHGTYWLSDTPGVPGSITWEGQSTAPRIVTGGLFHEKDKDGKPTGFSVYFYSTHFDHIGEAARQKSADLISRRIAERKNPAIPVILVGDFNAGEQSAAIRLLKGETAALIDSYRVVHPDAVDVATFNGFKAHNPNGAKIDYIFTTPGLKAADAEIIRDKTPSGRFPTDHFPIRAVLKIEASL